MAHAKLPIDTPPDLSSPKVRAMIGRRVKVLRHQKNWTQAQLAKRAGVQPNTVRGIETGKLRSRYRKLIRVCAVLGTTPSVLAFTLEGATDVWMNPLLKDLSSDDLRIAQRYHHATSEVRAWIEMTLESRDRPTGPPPPADLLALASRLSHLNPSQTQMINLLLKQWDEQSAELQRTRRRRRRTETRRVGPSDDQTTTQPVSPKNADDTAVAGRSRATG